MAIAYLNIRLTQKCVNHTHVIIWQVIKTDSHYCNAYSGVVPELLHDLPRDRTHARFFDQPFGSILPK